MTTIARTPWVDEVPDVAAGTRLNNAIKTELYDQIDGALAQLDAAIGAGPGPGPGPGGSGTVTHTAGPLSLARLVVGNAGADIAVLPTLGTAAQVLHGNAAGFPAFGPVDLSFDASGVLQAEQAPAFTGDVSSVAGTLALAIGLAKVTNAMLAGAITANKLVGTDLVVAESQVTNLVGDLAAIVTSLGLKAPLASPALTGTPTAPTAAAGVNTTQLATTAFAAAAVAVETAARTAANLLLAPLASPALTGIPTAPTAPSDVATTQLATTAFVAGRVSGRVSPIFNYAFSTLVAEPPAANQLRLDTAWPYTAVTKLWARIVTADGEDVYHGLRNVVIGQRINVQDKTDHTSYVYLTVTGTPIDKTTYFEIPVTHYDHGITLNGGGNVLFQVVAQAPASGGSTPVVQTTTLTGTQNDLALVTGCTELRCNNASLLTITGFANAVDGQRVDIVAVGAGQVDVANQSTSSTAVNRVICGVNGPRSLVPAFGRLTMIYDAAQTRWLTLHHEQGDWITSAYNAANFIAFASMVWTVDAGDITELRYYLRGKELHVDIAILTSTINVGGGSSQSIRINVAAFGGYALVNNANHWYPALINNNGTWGIGYANHDGAGLYFQPTFVGTTWPAATNTTGVMFSGVLAVV